MVHFEFGLDFELPQACDSVAWCPRVLKHDAKPNHVPRLRERSLRLPEGVGRPGCVLGVRAVFPSRPFRLPSEGI